MKPKLTFENTTVYYTDGKTEYRVIFTGQHYHNKWELYVDGARVRGGGFDMGHANKTKAKQIIESYLN